MPTGAHLAFAQTQHRRQFQGHGQLKQGVLLDQIGAHARQVAFGLVVQLFVQPVRHRQVQHRVAQKFKPLVVVGRKAAVRDRALQQRRIGKEVAQALLQGL